MKDEALKLAKSWLEANTYGDEAVEVYEAIEQALAAQPAVQEPVAWRWTNGKGWLTYGEMQHDRFESTPLYTAPPAPAVPDAIHHTDLSEHPQYIEGWNDCRQAMMEMMK